MGNNKDEGRSKGASPDDLARTKKKGSVELNEQELRRVAGGGIAGESSDTKHKDE
jgi:hypothetical protein